MKYLKSIQKPQKIKTGTPAKKVRIVEEKFSLCPSYSIKQLHKINTIQSKKRKKGQRLSAIFPIRKQISTRNAFNLEAVL
jgi:hypothetical protein